MKSGRRLRHIASPPIRTLLVKTYSSSARAGESTPSAISSRIAIGSRSFFEDRDPRRMVRQGAAVARLRGSIRELRGHRYARRKSLVAL
jgi:hypothetical protein